MTAHFRNFLLSLGDLVSRGAVRGDVLRLGFIQTTIMEMGQPPSVQGLQERFGVTPVDLVPKVYFRITDNGLELTVRFLVSAHGIRHVKDAMSREIVVALDEAGIGIASATYDIVGFPPIEVRTTPAVSA